MTSLHTDLDLTDAVEAAARHHWEHRNPALAPWDDVVTANPGLAHDIREHVLPAVTAAAPVIAAAAIARAHTALDELATCDHERAARYLATASTLTDVEARNLIDAILAEFDVTPRGKGMTIQIGGRRAGKTQALAERVADEVMKRGGSAMVISLPSVEDVARLLYERFSQNRLATWDDLGDVDDGPGSTREWYRDRAREVLELYPARQHGGA